MTMVDSDDSSDQDSTGAGIDALDAMDDDNGGATPSPTLLHTVPEEDSPDSPTPRLIATFRSPTNGSVAVDDAEGSGGDSDKPPPRTPLTRRRSRSVDDSGGAEAQLQVDVAPAAEQAEAGLAPGVERSAPQSKQPAAIVDTTPRRVSSASRLLDLLASGASPEASVVGSWRRRRGSSEELSEATAKHTGIDILSKPSPKPAGSDAPGGGDSGSGSGSATARRRAHASHTTGRPPRRATGSTVFGRTPWMWFTSRAKSPMATATATRYVNVGWCAIRFGARVCVFDWFACLCRTPAPAAAPENTLKPWEEPFSKDVYCMKTAEDVNLGKDPNAVGDLPLKHYAPSLTTTVSSHTAHRRRCLHRTWHPQPSRWRSQLTPRWQQRREVALQCCNMESTAVRHVGCGLWRVACLGLTRLCAPQGCVERGWNCRCCPPSWNVLPVLRRYCCLEAVLAGMCGSAAVVLTAVRVLCDAENVQEVRGQPPPHTHQRHLVYHRPAPPHSV